MVDSGQSSRRIDAIVSGCAVAAEGEDAAEPVYGVLAAHDGVEAIKEIGRRVGAKICYQRQRDGDSSIAGKVY